MTQKRTILDQMNLVDKFLFDEVMEDTEIYETVLSILMERQIHLLGCAETEKEFRLSPELREIRLDVIGMSYENELFFTEMQKRNTYNLPKRSRYYQAQVDVSLLRPGETDFDKLNDTCLIAIAPFDIFGKGLYRYTFVGTCMECPELKLEDGAVRVFINAKGKNSEAFSKDFLGLMKYITESTDEVAVQSNSERRKIIHNKVKEIKLLEKVGVKVMQRWEEEAYAREEGRTEGRNQTLFQLVKEGVLSTSVAARYAGVTEEMFCEQMQQIV